MKKRKSRVWEFEPIKIPIVCKIECGRKMKQILCVNELLPSPPTTTAKLN